jgi:hypothetical protein
LDIAAVSLNVIDSERFCRLPQWSSGLMAMVQQDSFG